MIVSPLAPQATSVTKVVPAVTTSPGSDEWVTLLLRQGDAKVFKKYSQMKLEALKKLNRKANEGDPGFDTARPN